jgi:hypothetical protein
MKSIPKKGRAFAGYSIGISMFRTHCLIPVFLTAVASTMVTSGATLQQLSMDQMGQAATSIVRARVIASSASLYASPGSPTIYTHYKLSVSEVWKGTAAVEVMMPGGDFNGQKQSFPGVPELRVGGEYLFFLWKSPSTGIVHTIGLTQGVFEVNSRADGSVLASRRQSGELMLDGSGNRVSDQAISMKLADMKARVLQGRTSVAGTSK